MQYCVSKSRNSNNRIRQIDNLLYFSRGDLLEIDAFYPIFEHICKKHILFPFLNLFCVFLCHNLHLSFSNSSLTSLPLFFWLNAVNAAISPVDWR